MIHANLPLDRRGDRSQAPPTSVTLWGWAWLMASCFTVLLLFFSAGTQYFGMYPKWLLIPYGGLHCDIGIQYKSVLLDESGPERF